MSKITIVSDRHSILNTIESKLILLRNDDIITKCDVANIKKETTDADIILFHQQTITDETLKTITQIKNDFNAIVLIIENITPQYILKAYDCGVCDFCNEHITNFELAVKIINIKKQISAQKTITKFKNILKARNILKKESNIFLNLTDIFNYYDINELANALIITLTFIPEQRDEQSVSNLETILKFRENDTIVKIENFKYLIIFPNTSINNALNIYNKIKENCPTKIKGFAFEYKNETPEEIQTKILKIETELDETKQDFMIWEPLESFDTQNDWLDTDENSNTGKNYKIFQNIYNKKIETIIKPVFYRTKQKFEKGLKNSKIKYFTDKDRCEFTIINFEYAISFEIIFDK